MTIKILLSILCISISYYDAFSQSALDKYFTGTNTFKVIGNASNNLVNPQDLDFVPGKPNEWWVINYEANSGSVVIFYNTGKSNQSSEFRRDSHSGHFMIRPSAIAIGDNGNFATTQEVQNTNMNTPTFMGPALWSSDTSIFARIHQSNWDPNLPLGSHIDMLHQSPYSMGVAYDNGNAYWVFDGYSGNICKYDFKQQHVVGGDDHSDGEILRYTSLNVQRKPGIPSHIALDKSGNWLYIVDGGSGKILRLKTNSGTQGMNLSPDPGANEPLALYKEMTGFTSEVVVSTGINTPCGIDYKDGRIVVSDNATGEIIVYDVNIMPAKEVGRINTGSVGVMGVRIDNDNRIWFVNRNKKELVRIDNPNVPLTVQNSNREVTFQIYPNPAKNIAIIEFDNDFEQNRVRLYDIAGKLLRDLISNEKTIRLNTQELVGGVYIIEVSNNVGSIMRKLVIE